ncbi:MAG: hypothetical protein LBJ63_10945 [Prevotellaceae bacterium]|jgi:hypothetical protein|nr:hypothetical protein [Prevotellaceae bacterium]
MKIIKKYYSSLAVILFITFITASCKKHDMEFSGQVLIDEKTQSAFIIHHFVPMIDNDTNYIRMVELNGEIIYRSDIVTFNAAPSGAAGRFFLAPKGKSNLKMYLGKGSAPDIDYTLVCDKDITLEAGQYYNVFVHDFDAELVVINCNYPFVDTPDLSLRDSCTYVKFYNFMYDSIGKPTTLRLQYKHQNHFNTNEWINIGSPLFFGESTGWEALKMQRLAGLNSGARTVYYRIYVVDENGNEIGRLQRMNSSGNYVDHTYNATGTIGRRVHHIFGGYRNDKTIRADVRLFYAR